LLLIATIADCIISNVYCAENFVMYFRENMEIVMAVSTIIIGSLFIYNVKNLRSDTW
jgi:hypothetical protein